jgi:fucose permease
MRNNYKEWARSILWLHLGFVLTGIGTTLFGCILPTLNTSWHMNDARAGILFAAQFSGSALGALLVRSNTFASVMRGHLLLIASAVSITFFVNVFPMFFFFAFGLSLGLTMTATSLLISSKFIDKRGAALSLLNVSWGVGAAIPAMIVSVWIKKWPSIYLFLVLAGASAIVLAIIRQHRNFLSASGIDSPQITNAAKPSRLVFIFAVLAFLYVGVESSVSGWMMTYVHRLPISSMFWASIATSCFWVAVLCGRAIAPYVLKWASETQLLASSLVVAFISVILVLLNQSPLGITLSAIFVGLSLGPIFPLCLARALALMNDSPKVKWVFATAGFGGAALPWMIGKLSAYSGSLRIGLVIPVVALGTMIILYWLVPRGSDIAMERVPPPSKLLDQLSTASSIND